MPTVTANGIPLYYQIAGEGEPVLWIQGLGADHSAWFGQIYAFRQSFRCIAFDNRDVGHSALVETPFTVADMADDAAALLTALGIPSAHIIGLSLGGSIAQELALRHPAVVHSLTIVSGLARSDARFRELIGAWIDTYPKLGTVDFYRLALPWLFSYRFFTQRRAVPAMLRYVASHPQPPEAFARQATAGLAHDTLDRLPQIRVPTLVVIGEEDILVPLRLSRPVADGIPGATLVTVPAAGHTVNVEQTATFNQLVERFLRRTPLGASLSSETTPS